MKKIISALLLAIAVFSIVWFRRTTQNQPLENTLVIGTSADYPPFSFRDEHNAIAGFDIDLVKELAKRLNMNIELKDRPFTVLLPDIELGQLHIIAAGMTPTQEREKSVHFSKPYITGNPLVVLSLSSNPVITSLEDLKNKTVIVNTGYISDLYLSDITDVRLLRLPKVADAFTALENGKADALVLSAYTAQPYLKDLDKEHTKFNIFKILETDESYALAISKKLPVEFIQKIEKILDTMQEDGTIPTLRQKWGIA